MKFTLEKVLCRITLTMEKKNDVLLFNSQQAVLSQSLRFSLKILEMNNGDLQEFINNSLVENPFLKENEENTPTVIAETENIVARQSFKEKFFRQLAFFKFDEQQACIADLLFEHVQENKYINSEILQEISKNKNISYSDVLKIIKKLQTLSPQGLFSFNIQDKIKNILELRGKCSDEHNTFIRHINTLLSDGLPAFRKCINMDNSTLYRIISDIKEAGYSTFINDNLECSYKIPDVIVEHKYSGYESTVVEVQVPIIDKKLYEVSCKKARSKNDKKYIKEHVEQAELLIKSISYRNSTLLKVLQEIVHRQQDFLNGESSFLMPISVKNIANTILCHPSTVHRAIMNKTVATPQGIFDIKSLMPKELKSEGSDDVATDHSVKKYIQKLINNEPKNSPYSDNEIVCLLKNRGINISRRTIAKYRNDMSISNSSARLKKYNSVFG